MSVSGRRGLAGGPRVVRGAVRVGREVHVRVALVAPHEADLVAAERDQCRDVVAVHGDPGNGRDEPGRPGLVVDSGMGDVRSPALGPGGPQLARRILVDDERLGRDVDDVDREAAIQRVRHRSAAVAVPVEPGRASGDVVARVRRDAVRGDVQVHSIPQGVAPCAAARVDCRTRVHPRSRPGVGTEDAERRRRRVPHDCPPASIVEPELALRLRSGWRRAGSRE